jgi:hypothetical protein
MDKPQDLELIAPLGLVPRARILGLGHSASVTARGALQ